MPGKMIEIHGEFFRTDDVVRLIRESGCPVAAKVIEHHLPVFPPGKNRWLSGGGGAHCEHTGDPFNDPGWPCAEIVDVFETLMEGH
jgi:hypothetical protein